MRLLEKKYLHHSYTYQINKFQNNRHKSHCLKNIILLTILYTK